MGKNYSELKKQLLNNEKKTISISMSKGVNDRLNKWCKNLGIKKSYLVEKLVEDFLKENKG